MLQIFVPSSTGAFGSGSSKISVTSDFIPGKLVTNIAYLDIKKAHMKYLDKPSERCSREPYDGVNTTACIANYIENRIGCSAHVQGIKGSKPACTTTSQLKEYAAISGKNLIGIIIILCIHIQNSNSY